MEPEETTQTAEGTVVEPTGEPSIQTGGSERVEEAPGPTEGPTATPDTVVEESQNEASDSAKATSDKPDSANKTTQEGSDSAKATSDKQTAQMGGNESFGEASPQNIPAVTPEVEKSKIRELFEKARFTIQIRKRKKMDKIMEFMKTLRLRSGQVTNDDVEKLLHVSDSTAERYLNILEKEGKIKQVGKGRGAHYVLNI